MCERHQLVYLAIITARKPTTPPDFRCKLPFVWQQSPKMPILRPKNNTENYSYLSSIFIQIFVQKWKVYIYSKSQGQTLVSDWTFHLSTFSAGYTSAILWDPVLRSSSCLVHARKEFRVIQPWRERRTPLLSIVYPPSTTSKISKPMNFLLLQTRPNCLGRSWNPSTKRPERHLHSWASMSATQHVWQLSQHKKTSHLCFLSEACLYPHSSLMIPDWGLLQRKMARKNTYKSNKLTGFELVTRPNYNNNNHHVRHVTI